MLQKLYRSIFWTGCLAVLITALIRIPGSLNKIKLGPEAFQIRLDHLLHFAVYFLICMYYLAGQRKGLSLFNNHSLLKFILVIILLGTVTEVVQLWIPVREFNPMDWVANVSGLFVGGGVLGIAQRRRGTTA